MTAKLPQTFYHYDHMYKLRKNLILKVECRRRHKNLHRIPKVDNLKIGAKFYAKEG